MDLLHLVDRLEELVGSAQKMPIGSRAIVDRRRILDIVDQMRVAVPQEVREAQDMVSHRDDLFREAEEEARLIVARAEERAARMVEQHELTIAARARAEEIAQQAEARIEERIAEANREIQQRIEDSRQVADQQMEAADDYARELLARLEVQLQAFVRSVQSGISQLQTAPRPSAPGQEEARAATKTPEDGAGEPGAPTEVWSAAPPTDTGETSAAVDSQPDGGPRSEGGLDELMRDADRTDLGAGDAAPPPPAEPGVIDDFAMPQLDDEPFARPAGYADYADSPALEPRESSEPGAVRPDRPASIERHEDEGFSPRT